MKPAVASAACISSAFIAVIVHLAECATTGRSE
jgi:hypothetical protein